MTNAEKEKYLRETAVYRGYSLIFQRNPNYWYADDRFKTRQPFTDIEYFFNANKEEIGHITPLGITLFDPPRIWDFETNQCQFYKLR